MKLTGAEYDATGSESRATCEEVICLVLRPSKLTREHDNDQVRVWPVDKAMAGGLRVANGTGRILSFLFRDTDTGGGMYSSRLLCGHHGCIISCIVLCVICQWSA